ncbi:SusD/RagB family nutrient-binding outer membrane lipoprotein [Maribacter polysaccharolyticus]|uniref:SusD/RagB family nutrient-binding outer membrane lipoprotein n=1 Tax=Maribacter polysaccharolyticus TaxID=3020831 RepID=UPI00237F9421|nr:SusD/RagB family nutrient-binding outer membrane lipoprotein [Maribacter polysaccharolyticus]MDE3741164.1 SusD/RagB family nutrient-binding outer membrane lipoprotein [Maribacter polysaccharolyticus]
MKNLKYTIITIISSIVAFSCSNFEDINTDPDKSTTVAPEMLATQVLVNTYRLSNTSADVYTQVNLFNKHTAVLKSSPDPNQYYFSYWPFGSFGKYKNLTDLKRMVEFSEGALYESSFKGLALFLKASYGFSATLDVGDVPYSEAGMAEEEITRPKYDKQAEVFAQILLDLQQAESYFAEGADFGGDIMFDGDVTKWRKLCNAMQLKVIQTISKKATTDQKNRFSAIVNAGNLMEGNDDNLKLVYSENPNATFPFWNGENQRIDEGVSKLVVDALKNFNDRRLFYFAEPAQAQIDGGQLESEFDAYVGAPTALAAEQLSLNNQAGIYSLVNKRYVEFMDGDPMLLFTYSEQCFIIAEAIEEGWVSGNAQEYYEKGVKAMLEYYMNLNHTEGWVHGMAIDQEYIDNYFTGAAAYASTGSKEDRLEQILTQRWLIDFFQGNGGNYPQFLRTGYPEYPLDPATSLNPDDPTVYPKRWKYPENEQTTNPENYQKAIDVQYGGFDGINQVPWYLKD